MDVRVYIPNASRDYRSGLTVTDIDEIVFNAPGRIIPWMNRDRDLIFDLLVEDSEVTVRREYGTDKLVVTFAD